MITYALGFALVCFGLGLVLNLWRLVFGPTMADRALALELGLAPARQWARARRPRLSITTATA